MARTLTETAEKLRQELVDQDETLSISAHDTLAAVLKAKWDGKKITKRIETDFRKAFYGEDTRPVVRYTTEHGLAYLETWLLDYNNRIRLFIGYTGALGIMGAHPSRYIGRYSADEFEDADCSNGKPAKERQEARRLLLDDPDKLQDLADAIDAAKRAKEQVKAMVEYGAEMNVLQYFSEKLLED